MKGGREREKQQQKQEMECGVLSALLPKLALLCMCAKLLQSCPILCDPMTISRQAPLSIGFSRQEYWSGLPCPPPEDLPDPEIEPESLMSPTLAGRFFYTSATWHQVIIPFLFDMVFVANGTPLQYFCLENPMDKGAW